LLAVQRGLKQILARRLALFCVSWLVLLNLWAIGDMGKIMTRSGLPLTPASQLQYQLLKAPLYRELAHDMEFLKQPGTRPGKIYVIGNPVAYVLADRQQAVPLLGWISEMLLPEQWQELASQLTVAHPNYLYVMREHDHLIDPAFRQFLTTHYLPVQTLHFGTWYQLNG
jgi:hypothetical protein